MCYTTSIQKEQADLEKRHVLIPQRGRLRQRHHIFAVKPHLDETLRRLHTYYQEDGSRKIRAVAKWVPMFIYLIIVAIIAYNVLMFYSGYFKQVNDSMTM